MVIAGSPRLLGEILVQEGLTTTYRPQLNQPVTNSQELEDNISGPVIFPVRQGHAHDLARPHRR